MSRPKLLVTGASGLLGNEIIKLAKAEFEVTGWVHSHPYANPPFRQVKVNLFNEAEINSALEHPDFDFIIHTAALSNTGYCQLHPDESFRINVKSSFKLAEIAAENHIPFVFTSTDLVFDGRKGNYNEADTVRPLNIYAGHKVEAEEKIRPVYPEALVVRVPWMLGMHAFSASGYLKNFISDMQSGKEINLFTDEYRSAAFASEVAKGILLVMNQTNGILHLGGPERLSRYDIGMLLANRFSLETDLIRATELKNNPTGAPRPADVSLDNSKAYQLGYSPKKITESLQEFSSNGIG